MGVVLVYELDDGNRVPNVHGNRYHYSGAELKLQYNMDTFKNIRSRYVQAMINQLRSAGATKTDLETINSLLNVAKGNEQSLTKILEAILVGMTEYFNEDVNNDIVKNFNIEAAKVSEAFKNVQKSLKQNGVADPNVKKAALDTLNELYKIMTTYSKGGASLFEKLLEYKDKDDGVIVGFYNLMGYTALKNILDKIAQGTYTKIVTDKETGEKKVVEKVLGKGLVSSLAQAPEFYRGLLSTYAENQLDVVSSKFLEKLNETMQGRKKTKNNPIVANKLVISKSVDTISTPAVTISRLIIPNSKGDKININHDLEFHLQARTSIKSSISNKTSQIGMVSSTALLLNMIKEIYGNSPWTNYKVYNSLAFNSNDPLTPESKILDKNFRIIRSDITAAFAEKFIAGLDSNTMQDVFIYNFKAYPMLYVINAVVDDAIKKSDGVYGSLSLGDVFSVSFTTVGNEWDKESKSNRLRKVCSDLSKVFVQGKFKKGKLLDYLENNSYKIPGIKI